MEAAGIEPGDDIAANDYTAATCVTCPACGAALALQQPVTGLQPPAPPDADLQTVITAWDALPAHLRAAIVAIVTATE